MSSFSSHPRITSSSVDHLATSIKLSYCYLTFYIVQILMAGSLCFMLFLDYLELIPFVEVPIAFFIMFDMLLSHYVEAKRKCWTKIQIVNILVLVASLTTIMLDLVIPHMTLNRIYMMAKVIIALRYTMQSIWIIKLVFESKKIIDTYKNQLILLDIGFEMEEELTKMTL